MNMQYLHRFRFSSSSKKNVKKDKIVKTKILLLIHFNPSTKYDFAFGNMVFDL
jgi:hypothetical protein